MKQSMHLHGFGAKTNNLQSPSTEQTAWFALLMDFWIELVAAYEPFASEYWRPALISVFYKFSIETQELPTLDNPILENPTLENLRWKIQRN